MLNFWSSCLTSWVLGSQSYTTLCSELLFQVCVWCTHTFVHACHRSTLAIFSTVLHVIFLWNLAFHWTWSSSIRLGDQWAPGSSCLHHPLLGLQVCTQILYGCWGSKSRFLCLSQHFAAEPPPQHWQLRDQVWENNSFEAFVFLLYF